MSSVPSTADFQTVTAAGVQKRRFRSVTIAIFAYNEQVAIRESVESALATGRHCFAAENVKVVVLANGCTDGTAACVREMSQADASVQLQELTVGDKSTTWNRYVHDFADVSTDDRLHLFMDGDVTCTTNVVQNMVDAMVKLPSANACSVLPAISVGRNRELNEQLYEVDGALFGNLYGLTTAFLKRIRADEIRMPHGAVGEDALVTEMVALDLNRSNRYDNRKAACAAQDCGFIYRSLNRLNPSDIRLQFHRMVRYQIRHWQLTILRKIDFRDFPDTIDPIDQQLLEQLKGKWLLHPIQWIARRRLQRRTSTSFSKS